MLYKVKDVVEALLKCDQEAYIGYMGYLEDLNIRMVTSICNIRERMVEPVEMGAGFVPCFCKMVVIDDDLEVAIDAHQTATIEQREITDARKDLLCDRCRTKMLPDKIYFCTACGQESFDYSTLEIHIKHEQYKYYKDKIQWKDDTAIFDSEQTSKDFLTLFKFFMYPQVELSWKGAGKYTMHLSDDDKCIFVKD